LVLRARSIRSPPVSASVDPECSNSTLAATVGSPILQAFALNPNQPDFLWAEDVGDIEDVDGVVRPVTDILEKRI
jgi:hypothetical protein